MDGLIINDGIGMGRLLLYSDIEKSKTCRLNAEPVIIAAPDLTPNDFIKLEKWVPAGFITTNGTINSHTSILIRNLGVPAVTNIPIQNEWNGKFVIIDAYQGRIIVDPTQEAIQFYKKQEKQVAEEEARLLNEFRGSNTKTRSGKRIHVYANITSPSDMQNVIDYDAEGIGVFKSEFLYLGVKDYPTEDEQFEIYKNIATTMGNKKVVIRTLDIGADKKVDYFNLDAEDNPAMGYRAIRICLNQPEIFLPQIKAILRASAYGNVSIMYPMVVSVEEVLKIQKIVGHAMQELRSAEIPFNEKIEQGIMMETPAAVMISEDLAKVVDFFSIGTNDLMQYLFAADRQNPKLRELLDPYHPAVTHSIRHIIQSAHAAGIWVGVSGELASDLDYVRLFVEYGIDALAVSPMRILKVRRVISEID